MTPTSFVSASANRLVIILLLVLGNTVVSASEDPLEPFNRKIFAFNQKADEWIVRPAAKAWVNAAPRPVQRGFSNVINNIRDVSHAVNALLQGRIQDSIRSTTRVLVNTTLGVGGILDVAREAGLNQRYADFGQTLAQWGLPEGPYLMLPIIGPSTVRDGAGQAVDAFALSFQAQLELPERFGFFAASSFDDRVQLLAADQLISGDPYIFIREAYLQNRRSLIDGRPADEGFTDFEYTLDEIDSFDRE